MSKFRFSLAALMGAVMIAALISATLALLSSIGSEITLVFGSPLVVLEAGLLGVVFRHGLARRFWI